MKKVKRIIAALLCIVTVVTCFAGCSKSGEAQDITSKTMLIAYTEECEPFIYEKDGALTGFDVELVKTVFDSVKNDFTDYKFVKVDDDYRIGEDAYCTDKDGKECIAYIMVGGVQKNVGDINEKYTFTEDIINNRVIAVTSDGNEVANYTDIKGKDIGFVGDVAAAALDKHSAVKNGAKSVTQYKEADIAKAVADLQSGAIKALIIDEFNYYTAEIDRNSLTILDGEMEKISYVFAFKKYDWYVDAFNEAINELQDPSYNDADQFTPIVEKYFGYDASDFSYTAK